MKAIGYSALTGSTLVVKDADVTPAATIVEVTVAPSFKDVSINVAGTGADDTADYRSVTLSEDVLTGTIDLSDITSNIQFGKITSTEACTLKLILPLAYGTSVELDGNIDTLSINTLIGSDIVNLSELQCMAEVDGDGNENTLTLTGTLTDFATSPNSSDVELVIKVK